MHCEQVTYYEFSNQHLDAAKRSAQGGHLQKVCARCADQDSRLR